ncbi:hypothetical protein [Ruegeria sp. Ofav3-42]|uniref:hypothetical protein n=1 Tax=Ruegeria sp. Ofav3-42 TaxID=2917759 RepID=UPI001EF54702|nr:hypothetical protein [Ruegeria sp. Ofav3-42]MCG7521627.1 hypothetical protein [Ruegeria sp. Ofav3-42]
MSNRRVKLRYFAIALLPVGVFGIHELILGHLIASDLDVPLEILNDDNTWLEAVGRFRFLAASWFFAALALLPVALLIRNLVQPTARGTRIGACFTALIIFMLALTPTIQQAMASTNPRIYHQVGKAVFETALSRGSLPGCLEPDGLWLLGRCGDIPVFSMFRRVLDIINALAGLAVGALIAGMILCLASKDSDDVEENAEELARNMHQMRQQLYLSSVILTFGMFFATSWMYWPMPLILDSAKATYSSLITASALFTGTYFCLLMLSFYIPVALILDSRIKRLARLAGQSGATEAIFDVEDWKKSHGLKEGAGEVLRAGIALAAPILASFAGGITPFTH